MLSYAFDEFYVFIRAWHQWINIMVILMLSMHTTYCDELYIYAMLYSIYMHASVSRFFYIAIFDFIGTSQLLNELSLSLPLFPALILFHSLSPCMHCNVHVQITSIRWLIVFLTNIIIVNHVFMCACVHVCMCF